MGKAYITLEFIKNYIEVDSGTNYKLLSSSYTTNQKIDIMCDKGHTYSVDFNKFKNQGHRCPICSKNRKPTLYEVKYIIETCGAFLLSDNYINKKQKLELKCACGNIFYRTFDHIKNDLKNNKKLIKCPKCSFLKRRKSKDEVEEFIRKEGYELLSEYINGRSHITLKCPKNHIYVQKATSFLHDNKRCPICNKSKGEAKILKLLEDNNIVFNIEHKFDNCVSNKNIKLRFDFYIKSKNTCIEFNGLQHYELVSFGSKNIKKSTKDFKERLENDLIKIKFCEENNIQLLIIPYYEFNKIEEILKHNNLIDN